jgi:alanine-glyoxylate transaminase/serine-glyoxylate transaminase/serine-pyruvate transaminase
LAVQCADKDLHSPVLTGIIVPKGIDADKLRKTILERFDLSLGAGLGKLKGRTFRIGHLGNSNDLTLLATLAGCEMGLKLAGVNLAGRGVDAAMTYFADHPSQSGVTKAT